MKLINTIKARNLLEQHGYEFHLRSDGLWSNVLLRTARSGRVFEDEAQCVENALTHFNNSNLLTDAMITKIEQHD